MGYVDLEEFGHDPEQAFHGCDAEVIAGNFDPEVDAARRRYSADSRAYSLGSFDPEEGLPRVHNPVVAEASADQESLAEIDTVRTIVGRTGHIAVTAA